MGIALILRYVDNCICVTIFYDLQGQLSLFQHDQALEVVVR